MTVSRANPRWKPGMLAGFLALFGITATTSAQPTEFVDLGGFEAPNSPNFAEEYIENGESLEYTDPPVSFSVQWLRFDLTAAVVGNLYLDMSARVYNVNSDVVYALYDDCGNLVAVDDTDGGYPDGGAAGLSFGSTAERVPFSNPYLRGQDGDLSPGRYWLVMLAGPLGAASVGATNWNATTTASFELGFDESQTYVERSVIVGNTIPFTPPANDSCDDAIVVGEDIGATPAWIGSNIGATQDGDSPCYPDIFSITSKDIWFTYVPSQTGWAQVVASGATSGDNADPLLTLYSGACGSSAVKCSGSGSFVAVGGTRLGFPVVQGQPVLLGLADRAGGWNDLKLNIDLVPPPCDLQTPAGAIPEIEPCGDVANNGCNVEPPGFGATAIGQAVSGTLYTDGSTRDLDWFEFTVWELATVTFTFKSQLPAEVVIMTEEVQPGGCFGFVPVFRRTTDILSGCVATSGSAPLDPGTYRVAITHLFLDDFDCDSGYNGYWISLASEPCDRPTLTLEPESQEVCARGTAVFTGEATSEEEFTYQWEWFYEDDIVSGWIPLNDGEFSDAYSGAVISGANDPVLTISGVDAAAARQFRLSVTSCGTSRSAPVALTVVATGDGICCPSDFDGTGFVDTEDFDAFVRAYELGEPSADFDGTGFVDTDDFDAFVRAFESGC